MSGNNQLTTLLSGTTSTTAGVTILPNTSGNTSLFVLSIVLVVAGVITLGSFIIMKAMTKTAK